MSAYRIASLGCRRLARHVLTAACLLAALIPVAFARESVSLEAERAGVRVTVPAIMSWPTAGVDGGRPLPAAVLIHSAGGYQDGTTGPLASALNTAGIATLELRFFATPRDRAISFEQMTLATFAALKQLSSDRRIDADRIGIAGFSLGAYLSVFAASKWVSETMGDGRRFAAHALIYPVCWQKTVWARGETLARPSAATRGFPSDFLTRFTGARVRIFAAGRDDYDGQDREACHDFVRAIDPAYRDAFDVIVYDDATHGWNQITQRFYAEIACKGRGCMNQNTHNPGVTARNTEDVVRFLADSLAEKGRSAAGAGS